MSGTLTGGQKARDKNLANNPNFYRDLGRLGGQARVPKGFAVRRDLASSAGRLGGSRKKKGKTWENSTSTSSTGKTRQTVTRSQKSSSTSNGGDLDRKTSSFLGKLLHRKENV